MDLPAEVTSENSEEWNASLSAFLEASRKAADDFKFSEEYGKEAKAKFCGTLAQAISEQEKKQTWDDELFSKALRANCGIMRERGPELEPLLSAEHISTLVSLAKTHTGTNNAIEDYAIKCLNNTFYGLDEVQETFLNDIPKEEGYEKLFALIDTTGDQVIPHFFNVSMHLVAGKSGSKISDEDCVESVVKTINKLSEICNAAEKPIENETWGILECKLGDKVQTTIENGLKYIYAVGATHQGVLPLLQENDAKNKPSDEDIADIVAKLSLTDPKVPLLDKLGFLLIHLLMSSCSDRKALQAIQHQVFCVLMFAGNVPGFADFLTQKGAIAKMVDLTVVVLKDIKSFEKADFAIRNELLNTLLPMLVVMNSIAENCESAKCVMSDKLFPYELSEPDYSEMNEEEAKKAQNDRHMKGTTPEEVPGYFLIPLMLSYNSNIKRFTGEWIWTLCDGDNGLFCRRVGYGNGVHMMTIKAGMMGEILKKQEEDRKKRQADGQ